MSSSVAKVSKIPSNLAKPLSSIPKPMSTTAGATKSNDISRSNSPNIGGVLTENTDDFVVGDRVWVGGTKPGRIQYIGDTQFAPGEWAGVVLDDTSGKNDGTVAGVHYFQCEPKKGVFSRLTKLTKEPLPGLALDGSTDDVSSFKANGSVRSASPRPCSTPVRMARSNTPSSLTGGEGSAAKLKVGDRVQVTSSSGLKTGTLRFLGAADFASGEWAGVELDETTGKNDGSVGGRRYFSCADKRGLFAPTHKVTKQGTTGTPRRQAAASSTVVAKKTTATSSSTSIPKRAGSHDSINTVGSTSSTARVSKPRLGVTSLTPTTKPTRSSTTSITATHTALQDALKEKEQHIEQLLKERDLERSEVARSASRVEEAERELAAMRTECQRAGEEHDRDEAKLREVAEAAEKRNQELEFQLEEERKKVEDLLFRAEEEAIVKTELEGAKAVEAEKYRQLADLYAAEKSKVERLEKESSSDFQNEELLAKQLDEIETLQQKLAESERHIQDLERSKAEDVGRYGRATEEVAKKEEELASLRALLQAKEKCEEEHGAQHSRLEESFLKTQKELQQHQAIISELKEKLINSEDTIRQIDQQLGSLEITCADQKRQLEAAEERCQQVQAQKTKLENEITDQMKSSGDSNSHLVEMTEKLRATEKETENLTLRLQELDREKQKLEDVQNQMVADHRKEVQAVSDKCGRECSALEQNLKDAQEEVQKWVLKFEEERQQTEAVLESKSSQVSALEAAVAAGESRESSLSESLKEARAEMERLGHRLEEVEKAATLRATEAANEINILKKEKHELTAVCSSTDVVKLEQQLELLQREKLEQASAVSERDKKLQALNQEVDRLKAEFNAYKAELQKKLAENELDQHTFENMRSLAESQQKGIEELQECLRATEEERDELRKSVERLEALMAADKTGTADQVASLEKRCEELAQTERHLLREFATEKEALQKSRVSMQELLEQKVKDVQTHQEEMLLLKQDLRTMEEASRCTEEQLRREVADARKENQRLEQRNEDLENRLVSEMSTNGSDSLTDALVHDLTKEREALKGQIDFLNSVIVDMHKKNDDLEARLRIMSIGGSNSNGGSDVNLNAIKTAVVAPRLFCDICDVFDLHDTEDCPRQASSGTPPPTQYHGLRGQDRPYCETCEIFGHWTNECDDNETF